MFKLTPRPLLALLCAGSFAALLHAAPPEVPAWAQPGSATHQQIPPPADFRRASTHYPVPLGLFTGQTDVGTAVVPGEASYDEARGIYSVSSAGYNIWYHRDEFRFLWRQASGDISLAATLRYPDPDGYFDRKAVLIIRQDLDDDAKEIMVALHGVGLIHLAQRPAKGADMKEDHRIETPVVQASGPSPKRLGIEKKGNSFRLFVSLKGEPMQPVGPAVELPFSGPFYVGIGFTSHLPATVDKAEISDVVFAEVAGAVR